MILQLFTTFMKIGAFGFGGGYAMIPLLSTEVVHVNRWLRMHQLIDMIAISEATPGPIILNCATYVGYKMAGVLGSAAATLGVILPSFVIVLAIAHVFFRYRHLGAVEHILSGVRPVIVALLLSAAFSVFPSSVTGVIPFIIAAGTFLGVVYFKKDPILMLLLAGVLGWILQFVGANT